MKTLTTFALGLTLLVGSVAHAAPALVTTAQNAQKTVRQLEGLSMSKLGKIAVWRDRSLRTRETVAAMRTLATYAKAQGTLTNTTANVRLPHGDFVVTDKGQIRRASHGELHYIGPSAVAGRSGESIAKQIVRLADKASRNEKLATVNASEREF